MKMIRLLSPVLACALCAAPVDADPGAAAATAGPGLLGRIEEGEELRMRYDVHEYYRDVPKSLRDRLIKQNGGSDGIIFQVGTAESRRTYIRSADATRFARRLVTADGERVGERDEPTFHPAAEVVLWRRNGPTEAARSSVSGKSDGEMIQGYIGHNPFGVPEDLVA